MTNEKRLISVDEWDTFFAEHIYNRCFRNEYEQGYTDALDRVDDWMDEHPTVDAVEVVHGHWLNSHTVAFTEECSQCGFCVDWTENGMLHNYNYCPNCGAKMDGGVKNA